MNNSREKQQIKRLIILLVLMCITFGAVLLGYEYREYRIRVRVEEAAITANEAEKEAIAANEAEMADNTEDEFNSEAVNSEVQEDPYSHSLDAIAFEDVEYESIYDDMVKDVTKEFVEVTYIAEDGRANHYVKLLKKGNEYFLLLPGYAAELPGKIELPSEYLVRINSEVMEGKVVEVSNPVSDVLSLFDSKDGEWRDINVMISSSIPAIFVDTESGSADRINEDKEYEEKASYLCVDENGKVSSAGGTSIHCRGISSFFSAYKKSYKLVLNHADSILGMKNSKKWAIQGNSFDASKLRNKLAYDMGLEMDMCGAVDSRFADFYINGEYAGIYLVCECADDFENHMTHEDAKDILIELSAQDRETGNENVFSDNDGKFYAVRYPEKIRRKGSGN